MFSRYIKLIAMLLCLCLLTACAAPAEETAAAVPTEEQAEEVTVESCTSEEAEVPQLPAVIETPWLEGYYIESPEMAEDVARAELQRMQELGILSEKFCVSEDEPDYVKFFSEEDFLGEFGRPYIAVRWYGDSWYGNDWAGENLYSVVLNMDPDSGRIFYASIEAAGDENAPVKYQLPVENGYYNEETGEMEYRDEIWLYHQNFYDLFPEGTSLADFCDRLNEYWGFGGWKLGGGGALNTGAPLEEITNGTTGNRYVVFEFEGNHYSNFMYVQIHEFPGRVCINFGTDHSKG